MADTNKEFSCVDDFPYWDDIEDISTKLAALDIDNVDASELGIIRSLVQGLMMRRKVNFSENIPEEETTKSTDTNKLLEIVDLYKELLDKKDDLAEQTKANNKEIEAVKNDLTQMMVNEECASVSRNGFKYILQDKVVYQKKSEEDLALNDVPFFDFLRDEGMGDIIKETVDSRTLSSTIKSMVEEIGELPEHFLNYIRPYETLDIMKRKETNKAVKKAGGTNEDN